MVTHFLRRSAFALCASLMTLPAAAQDFSLTDTKGLVEHNVKVEPAEYLGRKVVRLTQSPELARGEAFALLPGTEGFQDGTIEGDLAVKILAPPGVRMPGFIGFAFRAKPDMSAYDLFYIRPGNAHAEDQAMRNHAAQYAAAPNYSWYELRRGWPWVYEAHAAIQKEGWTHIKIEVAGRTARLYVNGATEPTLIVDGMKNQELRGAVALHGSAGEEAYFSNVRVTNAAPQPVKNGSDAAGAWQVKFNTDAGMFDGTLQLRRDGNTLTGTWSGALGNDRPVKGTWRNGYVELTLEAEWPKDRQLGGPGAVTATLAGWIDGDSGKGRMKIEGRTDGLWTATRKP